MSQTIEEYEHEMWEARILGAVVNLLRMAEGEHTWMPTVEVPPLTLKSWIGEGELPDRAPPRDYAPTFKVKVGYLDYNVYGPDWAARKLTRDILAKLEADERWRTAMIRMHLRLTAGPVFEVDVLDYTND